MALVAPSSREVSLLGRVIPPLTAILFAFFAVVPLRLPGFSVVSPHLVLMAVFHWTVYRPDLLPNFAVFLLGLLIDLLNGTPYVGLSALTLLTARTLLFGQRSFFINQPFSVLWGGFLLFAVGAFAFEWAILGLLNRGLLGLRPVLFESVLTVACFPVVSYFLAFLHRTLVVRP